MFKTIIENHINKTNKSIDLLNIFSKNNNNNNNIKRLISTSKKTNINKNKNSSNNNKNENENDEIIKIQINNINKNPNDSHHYFILYDSLFSSSPDNNKGVIKTVKLLDGRIVDCKYLLIKSIENYNGNDKEYLGHLYVSLANQLNGFNNNQFIIINNEKMNKLQLLLKSLDLNKNDENALELIKSFLKAIGDSSIQLLNGKILKIENDNNNNDNDDSSIPKTKLFIPNKLNKLEKETLIKSIETNSGDIEDCYFKLLSSMDKDEKIEIFGKKLNKLEIAKTLLQKKLPNSYLILYLIMDQLGLKSIEIDDTDSGNSKEISNKELLVKQIESIPIEYEYKKPIDSTFYNYYFLSTLLNGYKNEEINIRGKPMNKLDCILKALDLNETNESCKNEILNYLLINGLNSIKLLNGKTIKLNDDNKTLTIL